MTEQTATTLPALRDRATQNTAIGFTDAAGFDLAQRVAKAFAASTLVPAQYQNNLPNCLIALEMASRIGASPLLVTQNLYIVQGRPSWSAKFLIATFNQCGKFSALRYEWQGKKGEKQWGCRAWAIEKSTGERVQSAWITWELVEAEGWNKKGWSKWLTMPEQMFMYRAAAWLVNTHAPEISMGLNTAEEIHDTFDAVQQQDGTFDVANESTEPPADADIVITAPEQKTESAADKYPDMVAEIRRITKMPELIRFMNNLPAKMKKELHDELEQAQAMIRQAQAQEEAETGGDQQALVE